MESGILHPWWQLNGFTRVRGTDKFWRRVQKTRDAGACWPWLNGVSATGYGVLRWHGRLVYAHRLAYELYYDVAIQPHLIVRHHCDNPLCCRPTHLVIGTRADNTQDMMTRGRGRRRALNHNQVRDMRAAYASHTPIVEIAARFGVCQKNIWLVVTRRTYRHVESL